MLWQRIVIATMANHSLMQIQAIADMAGVVGIGFWSRGNDASAIAQSIRYMADLIGVEHVSLGPDFGEQFEFPLI